MRLYSFCLAVETVRIVSGHTGRMVAKVLVVAAVAAAAAGFAVGSSAGPDRHGAVVRRFVVKSRFVHRKLHEVAVIPAGGGGGGSGPRLWFCPGGPRRPAPPLHPKSFAGLA